MNLRLFSQVLLGVYLTFFAAFIGLMFAAHNASANVSSVRSIKVTSNQMLFPTAHPQLFSKITAYQYEDGNLQKYGWEGCTLFPEINRTNTRLKMPKEKK